MANDRSNMGQFRILIIDDEPIATKLFEPMFRAFGYETVIAHNGASGLNVAQTQQVDLIFLNELLPDMIATKFVQQIRLDKPIPIIVSSHHGSKIIECADPPFSYVIFQPITIDELKRLTQEALTTNKQMD